MGAHRIKRAGALIAVTIVVSLAGVPATATDYDVHCAFVPIETRSSGELVTGDPVCFGTLAEAVAHATGGAVQLPDGVAGADLLGAQALGRMGLQVDPQLASSAYGFDQTQGASHFAVHFTGDNGTGSSATVGGIYCYGWEYWNMNGAFVNSINSTYNACAKTRHYDEPNKVSPGPITYGRAVTVTLPGYFKDRTESAKYYD